MLGSAPAATVKQTHSAWLVRWSPDRVTASPQTPYDRVVCGLVALWSLQDVMAVLGLMLVVVSSVCGVIIL